MIVISNDSDRMNNTVTVVDPWNHPSAEIKDVYYKEMEKWLEEQYYFDMRRKSIEIMVLLCRTWTFPKFHMFRKGTSFYLRVMFSKSGWVSKKIRKIRKNR